MRRIETSGALRPPLLIGWKIEDPDDTNISSLVSLAENLGISFLVLELNKLTSKLDPSNPVPPENYLDSGYFSYNEHNKCLLNFIPLGGSDLALPNELWSQRVVSYIKTTSLNDLKTQIEWSCYVATRSIIVDLEFIMENVGDIKSFDGLGREVNHEDPMDRLVFISQLISSYLKQPSVSTIWVSLNCTEKSWLTWYKVYDLCGQNEKLKVCLKLMPVQTNVEIWKSEPVKCVILSEDLFQLSDNRLLLDETVVKYLSFLMENNVKVIIDSNCNYRSLLNGPPFKSRLTEDLDIDMEEPNESKMKVQEAVKLLKKIYSKLGPLSIRDVYGKGYEDLLQVPLQPLRDNLDSTTYNEFEKCSFKYNSYGLALQEFLKYIEALQSPKKNDLPRFYRVYVVGAGRGPLVEIILEVFKMNSIKNYELLALDKNPYTMITLQDKIRMNNWSNVRLVCGDMRDCKQNKSVFKSSDDGYREVFLIVSELLGPFGDNELAPECLYGFEKNFRQTDKLYFIPHSYTSYAMPVQAPQIWAKIKHLGKPENFHMPYTVHLKSYLNLGTEYLECFSFTHPSKHRNKPSHSDKTDRYCKLEFEARTDGRVHGFGAYFKCSLFDKVELSILPQDAHNIKSWFPMFFPIERPFFVNKSQTITLNIWRKTDAKKVWYEWAFTTPVTTAIHNIDGFYYNISKN